MSDDETSDAVIKILWFHMYINMETVSSAFFLLCLILCVSGWSGCGE